MVSTMEMYSLARIRELAPELRRGWTYPKVTKDWTSKRWAKAPMLAALLVMRQRLPGLAAQELPQLGVSAMWVYHPLVSARLARIATIAEVELIAWTVDDLKRMKRLQRARRPRPLHERPAPLRPLPVPLLAIYLRATVQRTVQACSARPGVRVTPRASK